MASSNPKTKIKIAIMSFCLLIMGVIAIAGGMGVIAAQFPSSHVNELIAFPSISVIVVTLLAGKLQEVVSSKLLVIIGIIFFLVGGLIPVFVDDYNLIIVTRFIIGIGIGLIQALAPALIGTNFDGDERQRVMGLLATFQMVGVAVMLQLGGILAQIGWNFTFYVHFIAVVSLICVIALLPYDKPREKANGNPDENAVKEKPKLTPSSISWALIMMVFFFGGMVLTQYMAQYMTIHQFGGQAAEGAAMSGTALLFHAVGGIAGGILYGKLVMATRNTTISIGLFIGVASYLMAGFSENVPLAIAGSFLYGITISFVVASVLNYASGAVSPAAIPLSVVFAICGQNVGQFLCPYIAEPIGKLLVSDDMYRGTFIFGAALLAVMAVCLMVWGIRRNSKEKLALERAV
ncbi:MAG: MFS transporter [Clostridiales Family XIII bacterium]|jgi:predicted MFS family arabinose efflux permease|nr:MFS transporter [Clostridiales Family XIII bacterium]